MSNASTYEGFVSMRRWSSGMLVAQYEVVRSPANGLSYERTTSSGTGTTDPSADTANYTLVGPTRLRQRITGTATFVSGGTTSTPLAISVTTPAKCRWRILTAYQGAAVQPMVASAAITTTQVVFTLLAVFGAYGATATYAFEIEEDW